MVDRRDQAGGHWNDAYPFVRLHQPANWYGVASRRLEDGSLDFLGTNKGMCSLPTGAEVLTYFDATMQKRFLPSGRVTFMPMCEYHKADEGSHHVRSLIGGATCNMIVRRKLVDATHARTELPSTCPPSYEIDPGVACVPINALAAVRRPYSTCTVVGSGKTGMDACIWLLEKGVDPQRIRWIRPRDAWFLDRDNLQPGPANFERYISNVSAQFEAIAEATSLKDLFARLEKKGALVRLDPMVEPETYRCATVSQGELSLLRRVKDVVRLGHVLRLRPTQVMLEQGSVPADADTLYVDCSARGIQRRPNLPVFDGDRINVLLLRWCGQPVFSAALIAYVESHYDDQKRMNQLCGGVPSPEDATDWLRMWAVALSNITECSQESELSAWALQCRLNISAPAAHGVSPEDTARLDLVRALGPKAKAAAAAISSLLGALTHQGAI